MLKQLTEHTPEVLILALLLDLLRVAVVGSYMIEPVERIKIAALTEQQKEKPAWDFLCVHGGICRGDSTRQ